VLQKRAGKIIGATGDRKKYKEIGEGYKNLKKRFLEGGDI
jgi:hypothetical protein